MAKKTTPWRRTFIKEWREWADMTLLELSLAVPYNEGSLSQMERGQSRYNQKVLEGIARVLDIPPHFLLSRRPPPKGVRLDPSDPEIIRWRIEMMDDETRSQFIGKDDPVSH